jgi:ribosomal protein S18 acetylase RimI-like enzyme
MTFRIREFAPADTEQVVELWQLCDLTRPWNDPRKDIARCLETETSFLLIAEARAEAGAEAATGDAAIVGTVMGGYEGHRGWLFYLASHPEHQGAGAGRALVAEAERRLEAMGCPKVMLMVRGSNTGVLGFYDKLGYEVEEGLLVLSRRLIED